MRILVTGSCGFIGQHLIPELLRRGHSVLAVDVNEEKISKMPWRNQITFCHADIYDDSFSAFMHDIPDTMIHLAWPGLPNYTGLFHFEENMMNDYRFIKKMILAGVKHVLVTGTCAEYGLKEGEMLEEDITSPVTSYGLAKDTLRKSLMLFQGKHPFVLQWARLFYLYGLGQNKNSLLAQLDKAIDSGDRVFNMSGGQQQRDYLPIEKAVEYLTGLVEHQNEDGIFNICSSNPVSVYTLVRKRIEERGSEIMLNLGFYPYLDYEPMSFWGNNKRIWEVMRLERWRGGEY